MSHSRRVFVPRSRSGSDPRRRGRRSGPSRLQGSRDFSIRVPNTKIEADMPTSPTTIAIHPGSWKTFAASSGCRRRQRHDWAVVAPVVVGAGIRRAAELGIDCTRSDRDATYVHDDHAVLRPDHVPAAHATRPIPHLSMLASVGGASERGCGPSRSVVSLGTSALSSRCEASGGRAASVSSTHTTRGTGPAGDLDRSPSHSGGR